MTQQWQVIVVGAGPAGVSAAVAAARAGRRVLLVERCGFAGGMATAALVNPYAGNCYVNRQTGRAGDIVAGLFAETLARLRARGAAGRFLFRPEGPSYYDAFDELQLRIVLDEMLAEAGVDTLLHASLLEARQASGRMTAVRVLGRGNQVLTLAGDQFIDSTGDGDLAAAAGVAFDVGRPEDGLCQPASTMFRLGGVDKASLMDAGLRVARQRVSELYERARQTGRLDYPFKPFVQFYDYPRAGSLHFNMTRVWKWSALDSWQLGRAEREGRRQIDVLVDWLRREAPWFANACVEAIGSQIGVRESRRIRARYRMTADDIVAGARFADGIARSGYFIDIHSPTDAVDPHAAPGGQGAVRRDFAPSRYYEIPFRSLQPADGPSNLLVACRALGASFEAHAATRVMPTMHAVGEAAGLAAATAADAGVELGELDGQRVRERLGYLDRPLDF